MRHIFSFVGESLFPARNENPHPHKNVDITEQRLEMYSISFNKRMSIFPYQKAI